LRLDSNTTIVHNSGVMRLKGGTNISGVTSDNYVRLLRNSGIWFETSRSF